MMESPVADSRWRPKWVEKTRAGSKVGVTVDDHCFVVLSYDPENDLWHPCKHIPQEVAMLIRRLVNEGVLDS